MDAAQASARTPRELPANTFNHVIFTCHDPVTLALVPMLEKYGHPYVILTPSVAEALELYEQGVRVAVGALDDPETYRKMRIENAAMLIATRSDVLNASITFTAREMNEGVPIVGSATTDAARDVLELAGATLVLRPVQSMGQALARRVLGKDAAAHEIGNSNGLIIAEANASGTTLEGLTLANSAIRQKTGVSVIGVWDHGHLTTVDAATVIGRHDVLVMVGTGEQIASYNSEFSHQGAEQGHVILIGGGKVGRIASKELQKAGMQPVIIEKHAKRVRQHPEAIVGDATHMDVLKAAGAREAATIIITSHDDDVNISLTIFFRRLRADIQIISRCTRERNARTLHRAGADLVLSSASMGANTIFNLLRKSDNLLLAEGVCIFPSPVPQAMRGRRLIDCAVRSETGCTIIAVETQGERIVNLEPDTLLPENGTLLLVGTLEAEERFLKAFKPDLAPEALRRSWLRKGG